MTTVGPDMGGTSAPPTAEAPDASMGSAPARSTRTPAAPDAPDAPIAGGYGNIYTPHAGSMIIQVQRESGLQSRTIVLSARQIRVLRFIMSRTGKMLAAAAVVIAVLLIAEAARVPTLTYRISRMEHTAQRLDTLERSLSQLQKRYDQVRTMMGGAAAADADHTATGVVGYAPAPSAQTRVPASAPANTSVNASAGAATNAAAGNTATNATGDAAAPDVATTPPLTTGDGSADSAAVAAPAARSRKARHTPAAPAAVVVPPPPDSGAPPSPEAEPQ